MDTKNQTMMPTMATNAHTDITGNPSVAKSSVHQLNDRSNGKPLRLLTDEQWDFWTTNGYIVIKKAIPCTT